MTHWEELLDAVPWFLEEGQVAEVGRSAAPGAWRPVSADFSRLFPRLDALLRTASVTPIGLSGRSHQLFSWSHADGYSCAWLAPAPSADPAAQLHPDHRTLLRSFGGIVERSNDPAWWLLNHNEALTEQEARHDGGFIRDYAQAFGETGIPIELERFYSIAREANGNTTLCIGSGEVILFAPDHAFDYVQALPGCPEYTLYRMSGAHSFRDWVNEVARQWHDAIGGGAAG